MRANRSTLSAVIVAWNEQDFIAATLCGIARLVDEVIVIDNGSDDKTKELVESFAKTSDTPVVLRTDIREFWKNEVELWKRGVGLATGDYTVLLDAANLFCETLPKDTLRKRVHEVGKHGGVCILGRHKYGDFDHSTAKNNGWIKTALMFHKDTEFVTNIAIRGYGRFWGGYPSKWPRLIVLESWECGMCRTFERIEAGARRRIKQLLGRELRLLKDSFFPWDDTDRAMPVTVIGDSGPAISQVAERMVPVHRIQLSDTGAIKSRELVHSGRMI